MALLHLMQYLQPIPFLLCQQQPLLFFGHLPGCPTSTGTFYFAHTGISHVAATGEPKVSNRKLDFDILSKGKAAASFAATWFGKHVYARKSGFSLDEL
jgi:hypothetical protein